MLTWIATKNALKKAWTWTKHNWYAPLVVIYTLALWVLFRRKDKAREVLEIRAKSYEEQIKELCEYSKNLGDFLFKSVVFENLN